MDFTWFRFHETVKNMPAFIANEDLKRMVLLVFGVQQLYARYFQQFRAMQIYGQEAEALVL